MPQAKEGDNTTSQPWSVQWETKAKWEAQPGTAYSGSLCGMGMVTVGVMFGVFERCRVLKTSLVAALNNVQLRYVDLLS